MCKVISSSEAKRAAIESMAMGDDVGDSEGKGVVTRLNMLLQVSMPLILF